MEIMHKLIFMGGYAEFVWPAYAITFIGLILFFLLSRRIFIKKRKLLDKLSSEKK